MISGKWATCEGEKTRARLESGRRRTINERQNRSSSLMTARPHDPPSALHNIGVGLRWCGATGAQHLSTENLGSLEAAHERGAVAEAKRGDDFRKQELCSTAFQVAADSCVNGIEVHRVLTQDEGW